MKVSYFLKGYFNVNIDAVQGLKYLTEKGSSEPRILFIYDQILKNGYVVRGGYSIDLPENWVEKLSSLSIIYSNGSVILYSGR